MHVFQISLLRRIDLTDFGLRKCNAQSRMCGVPPHKMHVFQISVKTNGSNGMQRTITHVHLSFISSLVPWFVHSFSPSHSTMKFHFDPVAVLGRGLAMFDIDHDKLNDANKHRRFREKYGCGPRVVATLWAEVDVEEQGADLKHLFWTLHFFKVYPVESEMRTAYHSHPTTIRLWIRRFTGAIAALAPARVSK